MRKKVSSILGIVAMLMGFNLAIVYGASGNGDEPYPNLAVHTLNFKDNFVNYYILHNQKNPEAKGESLIIYLTGSGMDCALGIKQDGQWQDDGLFIKAVNKHFSSQWDILVPEKINITVGNDHSTDAKVINHYSLEERVSSAVFVIDSFLRENDYKNVYLVGVSEGASILPKVYNGLVYKDKIAKLVSLGGGGLSQYEEFKILQASKLSMPEGYRMGLAKVDAVMTEIKQKRYVDDNWYLGNSYKRWAGFLPYRPLDDYIQIEIPILLVHGEKDISAPVESSQIVVNEFKRLGKTNLTYFEYKNGDHRFNGDFDSVLSKVAGWMFE